MRGWSIAAFVLAIVAAAQPPESRSVAAPVSPALSLVVRPLPASPHSRRTQQQQAADDDAEHHDRAEGTPRVVVFAVLNEETNHGYDPTGRSDSRGSSLA